MRNFLMKMVFVFIALLSYSSNSLATEPNVVKKEFLQTLQKDGYITPENAEKAVQQYNLKDVQPSAVSKYLNISNGVKAIGFLMLVWAFWGLIRRLIYGLKHLILMVPVGVYQSIALVVGFSMIYKSTDFWASQASWVALFGVIANALTVAWIFSIHQQLALNVARVLSFGFIRPAMLVFIAASAYFGFYAIQLHSEILGFIAAVSFCCLMSFTISVFRSTESRKIWTLVLARANTQKTRLLKKAQ